MSVLLLAVTAGVAGAGEITNITHEASGSAWANVFDGGPVVFDSDATTGPDDSLMSLSADDRTRIGAGGSNATTSINSRYQTEDLGDIDLRIVLELDVGYSASPFPDADRTGGASKGSLSSVITFQMPVDEVSWMYDLNIDDLDFFEGSTLVTVENITSGQTLLTLTEEARHITSVLTATGGDWISISMIASGSGEVPPGLGIFGEYEAELEMRFTVPEPHALAFLAVGALAVLRRRGVSRRKGRVAIRRDWLMG